MNAEIITIGDELLIGQVVDTNSAWMAQQLLKQGIHITRITSISDTQLAITNALETAFNTHSLVLLTGGLGPTKDDITKKALADFFGVELTFDEATFEKIKTLFKQLGKTMTPSHHEQCYMPANAQLLENKLGTAPAMWFEKDNRVIVSMPGVPFEMKYLMEYEVLPKIKTHFPGSPLAQRTILTVGEGETRIAQRIESYLETLPDTVKIAYLPSLGHVRIRLSATGEDSDKLETYLNDITKEVSLLIPEFIYGYDEQHLEAVVGEMLMKNELTLSTAESCTGGFLAHKITSISGSSRYFIGSVIAYSNQIKENQLGVNTTTLTNYGAVSEQTVIEMVKGALALLKTDIAVATSGIAGPGGGTPEKPVGTIWLAVGNRNHTLTLKLQLNKDRLRNIQYTAIKALDLIRQFLKIHYY